MAQFDLYSDFIFDGIDSRAYGVKIVNTGGAFNKTFGTIRDIKVDTSNNRKIYKGVETPIVSVPIKLARVTSTYNPLSLSYDEEIRLKKWLFKKDERGLVVGDKCYYGVFSASENDSWINKHNKGYISLNFNIIEVCDYLNTDVVKLNKNSEIITFNSRCDCNERCYLDFNIDYVEGDGTFSIKNLTNGCTMEFENLKEGNNYDICCSSRILQSNEELEIILPKIKKPFKWIRIDAGINDIQVECSGIADITMQYQCKMSF